MTHALNGPPRWPSSPEADQGQAMLTAAGAIRRWVDTDPDVNTHQVRREIAAVLTAVANELYLARVPVPVAVRNASLDLAKALRDTLGADEPTEP